MNVQPLLNLLGTGTNTVANAVASASGRSVDWQKVAPVGWEAHQGGVDKLQRSFDATPNGAQLRLKRPGSRAGLDVSGLGGVIEVDPVSKTAQVQGMCTYEDAVDASLPFNLVPPVVPQLKTTTIGGAISTMAVAATSFRNGLPPETVVEMDVLTGTGEIVTCSRHHNTELFYAFAHANGSLGYAVRLQIELEKVADYVELHHVRCHDLVEFQEALAHAAAHGRWEDRRIYGLDGVAFSPTEQYLVVAFTSDFAPGISDYTRQAIYYRSLQHPAGVKHDYLTIRDYIWRWDTDWFWGSRALGAQDPSVRTVWPRQLRRSSVYSQLIGLNSRLDLEGRFLKLPQHPQRQPPAKRAGRTARAGRAVHDIQVPAEQLAEFLAWLLAAGDTQPVWICPLRLRAAAGATGGVGATTAPQWPRNPLTPGATWAHVGFWSEIPTAQIGAKVIELGGYAPSSGASTRHPGAHDTTAPPQRVKQRYDPDGRLPG